MAELSILIPSRNEPYLQRTIEDINEHKEGDTEVLWLEDDGRGQRGLTNELARRSNATYVMKVDAHCSFSQGFDVDLMKAMDDKTIMAPYLLKLDAEHWTPLPQNPSSSFCFDTNLVFQYNRDKENQELINEAMCLQGSAWIVTRDNYWKWNLCDETLGSWGGQAAELGIKAYLNGGVCKVNKNCFYAHYFREKSEEFPYDRGEHPGQSALEELRKKYKNKSIAGLVEKFNYPADWSPEKVKGLC